MGLFGLFKKETLNTAPENETEEWILGTYGMWSMNYDEKSWKYIAGVVKTHRGYRASMRIMLRRDWGIHNKEELLNTADSMLALYDEEAPAWDLCRACQILGMGYVAEWITREEMVQHSIPICQEMQKLYHSWTELYDSYLNGFRSWRIRVGGDQAEKAILDRTELCRELMDSPDGPRSLNWNLTFRE